jgi:hypothetical protein
MRSMFLIMVVTMLAGCAPSDIARSSCESVTLATGDPWSCTVKGDLVARISSISFTTESRNQIAHVDIALRVAKGTLRVGYRDLTGEQQLVITPSEPGTVAMQTKLHPERRSFTLVFQPIGGAVQGLAGTVKYSTP